jgi:hypothetical protein
VGNRWFHTQQVDVTWSGSAIRRWLNEYFYNFFTDLDKTRILETELRTMGTTTTDKIFLLSTQEAQRYFSSDGDRVIPDVEYWWLRSHSLHRGAHVSIINRDGSVNEHGNWVNPVHWQHLHAGGVRPAMWISR